MIVRVFRGAVGALLISFMSLCAVAQSPQADAQVIERANALIKAGNAKQAYSDLIVLQDKHSGEPAFDYVLGLAALDSGRIDDAIIAFERVLAVQPNHAGAQMDLARAYYAAGSFDLAEAAFKQLQALNPPPAARAAIARYLDAIQARKQQLQPGWSMWSELGLGYDSNITAVPRDFGAAAQQSFNLAGIEATGNAVKRSAAFAQGLLGGEYVRPLSAGWSLFGGGDLRARGYHHETDFNTYSGEARFGGSRNAGADQWRFMGSYLEFRQKGDAPGDPQPTNDRRMGGVAVDWRRSLDPRTQVSLGAQLNTVRFPTNNVEDFDQVYLQGSYLHSFERKGVPLVYLTAFVTNDRARNTLPDGVTTKSKNLAGLRGLLQYVTTPSTTVFGGLGVVYRRDRDDFARSTTVARGRDVYGEANLGLTFQFREKCMLRVLYSYTRNNSNIDIYDFDRNEVSSTIRCDLN